MLTTSNAARARRAWSALAYYNSTNFGDTSTTRTVIEDLLSDILHLCHDEPVDFDACLSMARIHFMEERQGGD